MFEVIPIDTPTLGDRSYLVHDGRTGFVVDPQRDTPRPCRVGVATEPVSAGSGPVVMSRLLALPLGPHAY